MKKPLKCKYCKREIPTEIRFETKKGCIWCDAEYWKYKMRKLDLKK